ncbi:MAG TPA: hypothetical protein VMQ17_14195 [Candidatus Sulfotelmatobacter sp.]|nr:hypothetical protein [Candidatus Sulfotelmatobacter sp.]
MKSGYLEELKSDVAARFEKDLRKPRPKPAVKPSVDEDAALEQQKEDHFARLLMVEAAVRRSQDIESLEDHQRQRALENVRFLLHKY